MFSGKVRVSNDALEGSTRGASQRPAEVRRRQRRELSAQPQNKMWTEAKYKNKTVVGIGNSSKMVDPDLALQLLHAVQQRNGSTGAATRPSFTEESLTRSSGIIPGAIAATVFIAFLLALYAVLWKCMVSPPQRKHRKDKQISPSALSSAWKRNKTKK
ncbi:uncharacterized protein sb:cb288 isoform X3 [Xiphias gladius]|uniref:uncharacterized protein sb:cb288 isoform X3 n=1 Tax=Xiphias gladius TaxID=8245 RepID=UPI001A97E95D|nr:uncharacterized protein sb:cb288 isoform X3 [Xiphias gladius]